MSAIEIRYLWSEQVFMEAADQHRRLGAGNSKEKMITFVVGALILLSLFMMFERGFQPADSMTLLLAVYWFLLRERLHQRLLRKRFLNSSQKDQHIHLSIDDDGVKMQGTDTPGFSWNEITRVVYTDRGFLLYQGANYIWLPVAAFEDEATCSRFAALSERKAGLYLDKRTA